MYPFHLSLFANIISYAHHPSWTFWVTKCYVLLRVHSYPMVYCLMKITFKYNPSEQVSSLLVCPDGEQLEANFVFAWHPLGNLIIRFENALSSNHSELLKELLCYNLRFFVYYGIK